MRVSQDQIAGSNAPQLEQQAAAYAHLAGQLEREGLDPNKLVEKLRAFQVAIPSWALGAGGTRFGRFSRR